MWKKLMEIDLPPNWEKPLLVLARMLHPVYVLLRFIFSEQGLRLLVMIVFAFFGPPPPGGPDDRR